MVLIAAVSAAARKILFMEARPYSPIGAESNFRQDGLKGEIDSSISFCAGCGGFTTHRTRVPLAVVAEPAISTIALWLRQPEKIRPVEKYFQGSTKRRSAGRA
jgi:hypothetical protein